MSEGVFGDYDHARVRMWSMVGPRGRQRGRSLRAQLATSRTMLVQQARLQNPLPQVFEDPAVGGWE